MMTETRRSMVLWQVVEHIVAGPYVLAPPDANEKNGDWLETFLKMSQFRYKEGRLTARSLYILPNMLAPTALLPVVRELLWERIADRERCKQGVVEWPDVRINYYQMQRDELPELDSLVKNLEEGFLNFPFQVYGLELDTLYGPEREDETITVSLPKTPPYRRSIARGTPSFSVRLQFLERTVPEFDELWVGVWDALGAVCREERRVEGYREVYWIPPEQYAKLLVSTLT